MPLNSGQLSRATHEQRRKIKRLLREIEELSDGEGIGYLSPDMPPRILIEFLESVIALERGFLTQGRARKGPAR